MLSPYVAETDLCLHKTACTTVLILSIIFLGVNKLTKKLRKPHAVSNQELLDFLSRSPTDFELVIDQQTIINTVFSVNLFPPPQALWKEL